MSTIARSSHLSGLMGWFHRAEVWLDDRGKLAWIITAILAFVLAWPLGLAFVGYMIWSKKMSQFSTDRGCSRRVRHGTVARPTGNAAFDAYRRETLRRLEEEQEQFEAFLQRLRDARDKAEFDQFMEERDKNAPAETEEEKGA